MAMPTKNTKLMTAVELISEQGFAGMAEAMQILMNEAMLIERNRHLNAEPYERSEKRQDYANGFKPKQLKTQLGELNLNVPQVRKGDFYPSFLEKGLRSERSLKLALAEMYVQGVSTRKVNEILDELCGLNISSSEVSRAAKLLDEELQSFRERKLGQYVYLILDARYEKVRQGGCVQDSAVLVAYGVGSDGKREVLGVSVALSEAEVHWRAFLESLIERGLHGLKCIVSDAHSGLKRGLQAVVGSIPWQRCQFHLQQNAQSYVTKKSKKSQVAQSIKAIFNAENRAEAERLLELSAKKYETEMPQLANWMRENLPEGFTVFSLPQAHQRRMRTSNMAERVNQEIKRRTRVARIFPNVASCERLVTAVLMEISEQWMAGKTYLTMNEKI